MQNFSKKNFLFTLICFMLAMVNLGYCFDNESEMAKADQYFAKKKYTESLEIYEKIFLKSGKASPSMLLKMAFINEGLGDYTQTLYYLSLHYEYAPSNETLLRMEKIAKSQQLQGYEYSDFDYVKAIFHKYYFYFNLLVVLIFGSIFGSFIYRLKKQRQISSRHGITFFAALIAVFILFNFTESKPKAIIKNDKVFLMSAPSAASELKAKMGKGHRVEILSKKDIWYKVKLGKQVAYIRENNLLQI
ncbi:SH3 domain-containing protein [uncultured Microscilla sp.]|uniref:SH3 domain-containing protein n=1 Tax=uncultured Microscilla sp. TaxID=432653 RepID=UPI0026242B94|nr:SH3 domain-containing protein [uncultured Microscilla sp.]